MNFKKIPIIKKYKKNDLITLNVGIGHQETDDLELAIQKASEELLKKYNIELKLNERVNLYFPIFEKNDENGKPNTIPDYEDMSTDIQNSFIEVSELTLIEYQDKVSEINNSLMNLIYNLKIDGIIPINSSNNNSELIQNKIITYLFNYPTPIYLGTTNIPNLNVDLIRKKASKLEEKNTYIRYNVRNQYSERYLIRDNIIINIDLILHNVEKNKVLDEIEKCNQIYSELGINFNIIKISNDIEFNKRTGLHDLTKAILQKKHDRFTVMYTPNTLPQNNYFNVNINKTIGLAVNYANFIIIKESNYNNVLAHELGHLLGARHNYIKGKIMRPFGSLNNNEFSEINKKIILRNKSQFI